MNTSWCSFPGRNQEMPCPAQPWFWCSALGNLASLWVETVVLHPGHLCPFLLLNSPGAACGLL
jgi:hypothetical protein